MIEPRICWVPPSVSSLGREAIELGESCGVFLDDWQAFSLDKLLGVKAGGKWAAFEGAVNTARQNGKNEIDLVRELAGLFLFGEKLLIHSAHEFKTSTEHQRRIEEVIQDTPDFHKRVKPRGYKHSHGEESIELRTGQRIRFMTRTKGGGRGHTGDCVVFDEAMILPAAMIGALMPTLSARSILGNPQILYSFTAVDQERQDHGVVAARLRQRALAGGDESLAYIEYSAPVGDPSEDNPDLLTDAQLRDRSLWAAANPAMGIRISEEYIANELRSMDDRTFAVERLGIGDWPAVGDEPGPIDMEIWDELEDPLSRIDRDLCLVIDVPPSRSSAVIAAVGLRDDGQFHVEIVAQGAEGDDVDRGTGWVAARLADLVEQHDPKAVLFAEHSPAESLVPEIANSGVEMRKVTISEHAQACGIFMDVVERRTVHHLGTPELDRAVRGAAKRPLGDSWAWSRKTSTVNISPLVACTLGLWAVSTIPAYKEPIVLWR